MTEIAVIKVGGALLESADAADAFFQQLNALDNIQPIIVHGGGVQVQTLLKQLGYQSEKQDGVRITPAEHMPYVAAILAGSANKQLVAYAIAAGSAAVGLSIVDGHMLPSAVQQPALGCVGVPTGANMELLTDLLDKHWLPVVASVGSDGNGNLLNINADHAAAAIAEALQCRLILLSDVSAVLDQDKQRITHISSDNIDELLTSGVIRDGMRVKVESARATATATGSPVTIAGWKDNINQIIQGQHGTQVLA